MRCEDFNETEPSYSRNLLLLVEGYWNLLLALIIGRGILDLDLIGGGCLKVRTAGGWRKFLLIFGTQFKGGYNYWEI